MKLKKWLLGLVTFAAMAVLCAVCAGAETYGDFDYDVLDDGTVEIVYYNGSAKKVDIPAKIDGKSVTSIGSCTFYDCTYLTSITIPNGVIYIGNQAFEGCIRLKSITIPDSVTEIGGWAFAGCASLTSVTIPDSITKIGEAAFKGSGLTTVKLPEKLTDIGIGTFAYTPIINNQKTDIKYIGSTIVSCDTEAETLTIGDDVTAIASNAFADGDLYASKCYKLKSITIPRSVKYIGKHAFGYYLGMQMSFVYAKNNDFSIKCYSYSVAEQYAKDNDIDYELLDKPTLSKVTGVKLGGRAADALRINWTKNASADGYIVETYQGDKWVRVDKITNNSTTTFRKAGLSASSVYKFRVRAYKMSGKTALYGNYSATVTARTNPSVMTGVKIGGKAKDALRVNWTKNSSAQGYIVEMYQGNKWVRVGKITNGNTTTFRKAGLVKNTAYKFRVCAYYMSGKTALYGNYGSVSGKTLAK